MPVAVACPKCQKKYNLPDKMMGRPVKCSECATQFKTPARQAAPQRMDPKQMAQQQRAREAAQQRAKELKQMGVDSPIQRAPDVFDGLMPTRGTPDPLSNHLIEDPGFGDVNIAAPAKNQSDSEDSLHSAMFENPAIESKKSKAGSAQGKKKKRGKVAWYLQKWFFALVIVILLGAIGFAVWYFELI